MCETKSHDLIEEGDAVLLKEKYQEYYENRFGKQNESPSNSGEYFLSVFFITFTHTMLAIFLQRFNQLSSHDSQDIVTKMTKAFLFIWTIYSLSSSVAVVAFDTAQRYFLPVVLEKMGVPSDMQPKISQI